MFNLPQSTEFNKRIPKQKFYDHAKISPAIKKIFSDQVRVIYWKNKIAATTLNLAAGNFVTEIEIFEIQLQTKNFDENILRLIDKAIPYHIIFILRHENFYKICAAYKENDSPTKNYFSTDWQEEKNFSPNLQGLNLDEVYENFLRQIGGELLQEKNSAPLKNIVERQEQIIKLEKKIAALQKKVFAEKQFNKQIELNGELKRLKKELENLKISK